jgi:hypothetical protein
VEIGLGGGKKRRFDELEEQKVREVAGAHLQFKPIFSGAFRTGHDAGVVDKDVELVVTGSQKFGGEFANRCEGIEVKVGELDLARLKDVAKGFFALFEITDCSKNARASQLEGADGLNPYTRAAASNQNGLSNKLAIQTLIFDNLLRSWACIAGALRIRVDRSVTRKLGRAVLSWVKSWEGHVAGDVQNH